MGTPNYLSPEVLARDKEHTLAIDIWSLGLIFFKMLTGKVAFPGSVEEQVFRSIESRKINWPEPKDGKPVLTNSEKDLIERML